MKKIFLFILLVTMSVFAENKYELTPFIGFDATIHRGLGNYYRGISLGIDAGLEALYTPTDDFGVGIQASTGIKYDCYMMDTDTSHDASVIDEYFPWVVSVGPVIYLENWYLSGMVIRVLDIERHNTYISDAHADTPIKKRPFNINDWDYSFEVGYRTTFHSAIGVKVSTNLINSYTIDNSMYNIYLTFHTFI